MKNVPRLMLGVLCFAASAFAQTKTANSQKWQEFTFLESGISISFPGEPNRTTTDREKAMGKVTELHLSFPEVTYMLSWADLRKPPANDDVLKAGYDIVRDQVLAGMSAKLVCEKDIKTDGLLGRELVFTTGPLLVKYRVYVVGRWQYQLTTSRYAGLGTEARVSDDVEKFLDSFHFVSQTAGSQAKRAQ